MDYGKMKEDKIEIEKSEFDFIYYYFVETLNEIDDKWNDYYGEGYLTELEFQHIKDFVKKYKSDWEKEINENT